MLALTLLIFCYESNARVSYSVPLKGPLLGGPRPQAALFRAAFFLWVYPHLTCDVRLNMGSFDFTVRDLVHTLVTHTKNAGFLPGSQVARI